MRRSTVYVTVFLLALAACRSNPPPPAPPPPVAAPKPVPPASVSVERLEARESGGLLYAKVGGTTHVLLADEDDRALVEIDPATKAIVATTQLESRPRDLLLLADGRLAVTLPDANTVVFYTRDAAPAWNEVSRAKVPADPQAMAVDPSETLYVTTGASHRLVTLDAKDAITRELTLGREPRAVLASSDHVFVTHAIEDFVSVVDANGNIDQRRTGNHAQCSNEMDCSGARIARNAEAIIRVSDRSFVIPSAQSMPVPAGGFSKSFLCPPSRDFFGDDEDADFVPRRRAKTAVKKKEEPKGYGLGATESGNPITADLVTFDIAAAKKWGTGQIPNQGAGCLLPRAGVATKDGAILVACTGSARLVRYTPAATQDDQWRGRFTFEAKGNMIRGDFTNGIEPNVTATKIPVPAGPTAIAKNESDILVWSMFARTISRIADSRSELIVELPRKTPREEAWLTGRSLFFTNDDPRISKDGRACANCHIDGADDGLTWKTPLGPRRTRLLRGELAKGSYGWNGEHASLAEHVTSTMTNLGGTGLPAEEQAKLLGYIQSLGRPHQDAGDTSRGQQIFASAECGNCHSAGLSDRQIHDVGTGGTFMTPTLASAGERRALMHDGRFKSLDELIVGSPNMGRGSELSPEDRRLLALYIETL